MAEGIGGGMSSLFGCFTLVVVTLIILLIIVAVASFIGWGRVLGQWPCAVGFIIGGIIGVWLKGVFNDV